MIKLLFSFMVQPEQFSIQPLKSKLDDWEVFKELKQTKKEEITKLAYLSITIEVS